MLCCVPEVCVCVCVKDWNELLNVQRKSLGVVKRNGRWFMEGCVAGKVELDLFCRV